MKKQSKFILPQCYVCLLNKIFPSPMIYYFDYSVPICYTTLWSQSFQFRCFVSGHNSILELGYMKEIFKICYFRV